MRSGRRRAGESQTRWVLQAVPAVLFGNRNGPRQRVRTADDSNSPFQTKLRKHKYYMRPWVLMFYPGRNLEKHDCQSPMRNAPLKTAIAKSEGQPLAARAARFWRPVSRWNGPRSLQGAFPNHAQLVRQLGWPGGLRSCARSRHSRPNELPKGVTGSGKRERGCADRG